MKYSVIHSKRKTKTHVSRLNPSAGVSPKRTGIAELVRRSGRHRSANGAPVIVGLFSAASAQHSRSDNTARVLGCCHSTARGRSAYVVSVSVRSGIRMYRLTAGCMRANGGTGRPPTCARMLTCMLPAAAAPPSAPPPPAVVAPSASPPKK